MKHIFTTLSTLLTALLLAPLTSTHAES